MTDKEKIKTILELFLAWNGETEVIDVANLDSAIEFIEESLQEEPVSEDLGEYISELSKQFPEVSFAKLSRIAVRVAKWQKQQMMANAVEGAFIRRNRYTKKNVLNGFDTTCDAIQGFKDKDKVKLIIIKED